MVQTNGTGISRNSVKSEKKGIPRKVLPIFRKQSTGMKRSIWILPGITENSIQMVSAPCNDNQNEWWLLCGYKWRILLVTLKPFYYCKKKKKITVITSKMLRMRYRGNQWSFTCLFFASLCPALSHSRLLTTWKERMDAACFSLKCQIRLMLKRVFFWSTLPTWHNRFRTIATSTRFACLNSNLEAGVQAS